MNQLLNKTLSQIVTENYQAAPIFEKYGLDFCCKGKRPLKEACAEKQLMPEVIINELNNVLSVKDRASDFQNMSLTELCEYIVRVHHSYVKENAPQILNYLLRVVSRHTEHFPYMKEVYQLFNEVKEEMDQHMLKEEKILFPRIKQLDQTGSPHNSIEFLQAPIDVMEEEHEKAGGLLQRIKELTGNYAAPQQACTTFRLAIDSLKAFEEDLHKHVHLENNILFPKAIERAAANLSCVIK